ncbi:hypothetical protein ACLK1S_12865 [Escherichia coli]
MIWVLSESIGALALVPLDCYLNHTICCASQVPGLLFEVFAAHVSHHTDVKLALMLYLPSPFTFIIVLLMWSAVRLPQDGSLFNLPYHGDDGVADDGRESYLLTTPRTYLMSHMPSLCHC